MEVFPIGVEVPSDFCNYAAEHSSDAESCLRGSCIVLVVDLNRDNIDEYMFFRSSQNDDVYASRVYKKGGKDGCISQYFNDNIDMKLADLRQLLIDKKIELKELENMNLKIGEKVLNTSSARDPY